MPARAIAQYRGEFLPGVYDDWVLEARAQLERQCADLCDLLCATPGEEGRPGRGGAVARRRIQLQPLEEAGYRALMQLQADLGDRAGAVSTYHHCASVLERELGIIPDPATRLAFQRLLADAAHGGAAGPPIERPLRRAPGSPRRSWSADPPSSACCRTSGEPRRRQDIPVSRWSAAAAGVGKTRLVAELAELARQQGAVVAGSQCFGRSGRLALAPVADWLRNPAVAVGHGDAGPGLAG